MTATNIPWEKLFEPHQRGSDSTLTFRVVRKAGEPFLLLPTEAELAAQALTLYPAQTGFARFAAAALRILLRVRLPLPLEIVQVGIATASPFVQFLADLGGGEMPPPLAILAGNPRAAGRRFIVLVFGKNRVPAAVVKAGMGAEAAALIEREREFLASVPATAQGVPQLRASFNAEGIRAFTVDFIEGHPSRGANPAAIAPLLTSWLDLTRRVPLRELPAWQRLVASFPITPSMEKLVRETGNCECHPALAHGDFAPWNVRVSPGGEWTVLDWERAQTASVPAWDWFHYFVQTSILVGHEEPARLANEIEGFLNSAPLCAYAEKAGIAGRTRELLLAYLLYCSNVLKPTEGLGKLRQLLTELGTRWLLEAM